LCYEEKALEQSAPFFVCTSAAGLSVLSRGRFPAPRGRRIDARCSSSLSACGGTVPARPAHAPLNHSQAIRLHRYLKVDKKNDGGTIILTSKEVKNEARIFEI